MADGFVAAAAVVVVVDVDAEAITSSGRIIGEAVVEVTKGAAALEGLGRKVRRICWLSEGFAIDVLAAAAPPVEAEAGLVPFCPPAPLIPLLPVPAPPTPPPATAPPGVEGTLDGVRSINEVRRVNYSAIRGYDGKASFYVMAARPSQPLKSTLSLACCTRSIFSWAWESHALHNSESVIRIYVLVFLRR